MVVELVKCGEEVRVRGGTGLEKTNFTSPLLCAVCACVLCLTALPWYPSSSGVGMAGGGGDGSCAAAPSAEARAVSKATAASEARP